MGLLIIQSFGREETSASQILVAKLQHSNAGSGELGSSSFWSRGCWACRVTGLGLVRAVWLRGLGFANAEPAATGFVG